MDLGNGLQAITLYGHNDWNSEQGAVVFNSETGQFGAARLSGGQIQDMEWFDNFKLALNHVEGNLTVDGGAIGSGDPSSYIFSMSSVFITDIENM